MVAPRRNTSKMQDLKSPSPSWEGARGGGLKTMTKPAVRRARALRKEMTEGERSLWNDLRQLKKSHGLHVRRQAPIGLYIADFVIHAQKLVIEVDGEFHQREERMDRDGKRDAWFFQNGYRTLRISSGDLHENKNGCIEAILNALTVDP